MLLDGDEFERPTLQPLGALEVGWRHRRARDAQCRERTALAQLVADGVEQGEAPFDRTQVDLGSGLRERHPRGDAERDRPSVVAQRHAGIEDVLHPGLRLGELAADPPVEEAGARRHARPRRPIPIVDQVAERRAQVVALGLEPRQCAGLRRALQERLDLGGEPQVVLGVRAAHRMRHPAASSNRAARDLTHRDEHREERDAVVVVLAQEAAVDELEQRARAGRSPTGRAPVIASTASRLKSPANTPRRTNRARASELSRSMLHSTVAWIVRWRSGMSRAAVTSSGQHPIEPSEHRRGRERPDAGRRELDRERHALERPADAGDAVGVLVGQVEARVGGASAIEEEPHRGRRRRSHRSTPAAGSGGSPSGSTSKTRSPRTRRRARLVTRNGRVGQVVEQRHDIGGGRDHLLEAVEHDEVAPAGAGDAELLAERHVGRVAHPELPGDRREHVRGVAHVLEHHERHPVERARRHCRATSIASRLLPIPPGPTSVTSRCVSSREPLEQRRDRALAADRLGERHGKVVACRPEVSAASARRDGRRDASNRSASRIARSASMSSASSSAARERRVRRGVVVADRGQRARRGAPRARPAASGR